MADQGEVNPTEQDPTVKVDAEQPQEAQDGSVPQDAAAVGEADGAALPEGEADGEQPGSDPANPRRTSVGPQRFTRARVNKAPPSSAQVKQFLFYVIACSHIYRVENCASEQQYSQTIR